MEEIKTIMQQNWNKNASRYDAQYQHGLHSEEEKAAWLRLLGSLIPEKGQMILDVGAGTGFLSLLLAEQGHWIKAVDLSPGMLEKAEEKAQDAGLIDKITFAIGDAENLAEPDSMYDVVVNRHLLWAMPDPDRAITEWRRVLKPGGKLIIIDGDWHYNSLKNNVKIFCGKFLTLVSERKNMFRKYRSVTAGRLPMTKPENAKKAPDMVRKAGFRVTVRGAEEIEAAEKRAMPLRASLLNPYHRIIIIGIKE